MLVTEISFHLRTLKQEQPVLQSTHLGVCASVITFKSPVETKHVATPSSVSSLLQRSCLSISSFFKFLHVSHHYIQTKSIGKFCIWQHL